MQTPSPIRTLIFVAVWSYAAATWASISHNLFGLPDLVPAATVVAGVAAAAWSMRPRSRDASAASAPGPDHLSVADQAPTTSIPNR